MSYSRSGEPSDCGKCKGARIIQFTHANYNLRSQYSSSTLGIFDMDKSSSNVRLVQAQPPLQFSGSGPVESRQERSHPHQVYGVKDQTKEASPIEILVPDLGSDKIIQLSKGSGGKWEKKSEISLDVKNLGGGPRHVVVHSECISM